MKSVFLKLIFLLLFHVVQAQHSRYWIYPKTPENSKRIRTVLETADCFEVSYYSEWIKAFSVTTICDNVGVWQQIEALAKVEKQGYLRPLAAAENKLGFALQQIGAEYFLDAGLDGSGVKVGIIDGGFLDANNDPSLEHIFRHGRIKAYRDYVTPEMTPYDGRKALDDRHGTDVLQLMAGVNVTTGVQLGMATEATYYLARTDHGGYEQKIEEEFLIKALTWMDSMSVKLVNISLGYNTGFDSKDDNYLPTQMDGSSAVARAVDYAFEEKGMLIVVSAGNDGNGSWQIVSTPADSRHALTVGSTKLKHWDKAGFSSIGPEQLSFVKPEITCFASNGTSFSTPIITSIAALIWQAKPSLSNAEVKSIILKSGHLYPFGNNYVGYGVPDARRILTQLQDTVLIPLKPLKVEGRKFKLNTEGIGQAVIYHKSSTRNVLDEDFIRLGRSTLKIKKPDDATHSTIVLDNKLVRELIWQRP